MTQNSSPNTGPLPGWIRSSPVAHRGLHNIREGIPENSRAAFAAAMAENLPIELDVRLSRDGVPMVFHDATLERSSGRPENLGAIDAATLQQIEIFGTRERIPSLAEVLQQVAGRVPILIEVKNYADSPVGPLEESVRSALARYRGATALQSFSPDTVAWFAREMPNHPRGQLASPDIGERLPPERKRGLEAQLEARHGAPHFIGYNVKHLPCPYTDRARADGLPVLAWTVRSADDHARARAHADNIIFERE